MDPVEQLIGTATLLFAPASEATLRSLPVNEPLLGRLLEKTNGLFALGGALHVFGVDEGHSAWHDAILWNSPATWRGEYAELIPEDWWSFAETGFGDQFFLGTDGRVNRFLSETAHIGRSAPTLQDWVHSVIEDPEGWCDSSLLHDWRAASRREIAGGEHLCPRIPFSLGGRIEVPKDAYLCDSVDNMIFKGQLARQLAVLKPGDKVNLRGINLPTPSP